MIGAWVYDSQHTESTKARAKAFFKRLVGPAFVDLVVLLLNYSELYARPDAANCWAHSCGCAAPGLRS